MKEILKGIVLCPLLCVSSFSISSIAGRSDLSASGKALSGKALFSSNSEMPIGLCTSRKAYSAMIRSLVWHRISPMVGPSAHQVIHRRTVEIHLSGIFGLELPFLQVNDHKTPHPQVVKQQIQIKILLTDLQPVLSPTKAKPVPAPVRTSRYE
jgi:hypothetical protein